MRTTRIEKRSLPDHDGGTIVVCSSDGDEIGVLKFDGKGTSKWTDLWDLPPHRRWPLKRKHRKQ